LKKTIYIYIYILQNLNEKRGKIIKWYQQKYYENNYIEDKSLGQLNYKF